jgi:hypothetical protein
MRKSLQIVFLACLYAGLGAVSAGASGEMEEYRVKALFLYNSRNSSNGPRRHLKTEAARW